MRRRCLFERSAAPTGHHLVSRPHRYAMRLISHPAPYPGGVGLGLRRMGDFRRPGPRTHASHVRTASSALLTLDNPAQRNAMSDGMTSSWVAAVNALPPTATYACGGDR